MLFGVVACLLVCLAVSTVHASPVVTPEYQQIKTPGKGVVRCDFRRQLDDCRIRVSEHTTNIRLLDKLADFRRGPQSALVGSTTATARYAGVGLAEGHCGVELELRTSTTSSPVVLVECLGHNKDSGWSRGFGLLSAIDDHELAVTSRTPWLAVAAPGTDVAIHFTAQGALQSCRVFPPSTQTVELSPGETLPAWSRYRTHGAGADDGECGLLVPDVGPSDAGVWFWQGYQESFWNQIMGVGYYTRQATVVVVLSAPEDAPVLTVHDPSSLRVGGLLTASCRAPPGVPPAKLTWLLGGQEVRRDSGNDTRPGDLGSSHPWQPQPVVQTFARRLAETDLGKRLECRMEHSAMSTSRSAAYSLPAFGLDCGARGPALIAGGDDANAAEFPWHVGVYRTEGTKRDVQDCGGSIISKTFVISAAHCFWDEKQNKLKSHRLYRVAAGKRLRALSQHEANSQVREVAEINVPRRFRGRHSNFQYDIAVVRLDRDFDLTSSVAPVCLDTSERRDAVAQLSPGVKGTVAGWGFTLNNTASNILQKIDLPYVDFDTCFDALSDDLKKFHTDDKFCAGFSNQNRSVCTGDSGGGLVFATYNRYFLRGVVSIGFKPAHFKGPCYAQQYAGFTNVGPYLSWINTFVEL